jgi:hypothetical protein
LPVTADFVGKAYEEESASREDEERKEPRKFKSSRSIRKRRNLSLPLHSTSLAARSQTPDPGA